MASLEELSLGIKTQIEFMIIVLCRLVRTYNSTLSHSIDVSVVRGKIVSARIHVNKTGHEGIYYPNHTHFSCTDNTQTKPYVL